MLDSAYNSTKTDLDSWIASLGFERGNPFAAVEADEERDILPEYFVDVDAYERIKGAKTIIVFAPRGGGKSALRVVLANQAAPVSPESKILAIEYTDFAPLIRKLRAGEPITVDDHVDLILRAGVEALFTACCGYSSFDKEEEASNQDHRIKRVKEILPPVRSRLARWVRTYQPQLLDVDELYRRLHSLDSAFAPVWEEFEQTASQFSIRNMIKQSSLEDHPVAFFLADLNDASVEKLESVPTPKEAVTAFLKLTQSMGFDLVQVLMDRMDEAEETVNDPDAQADILEPLLAELPILEMPRIAFKFLLSQEAHQIIVNRPTFRSDRIREKEVVTVQWEKERLKKLLDERLSVFSNQNVQELAQICNEGHSEATIEEELIDAADGSPRRLLLGGQLLFEEFRSRTGGTGRIDKGDWRHAKEKLLQIMPIKQLTPVAPPTLKIYRNSNMVSILSRNIEFPPLQHRILLTLASAKDGICDRDGLREGAWKSKAGVSDAAIDQEIKRIRIILKDNPKNPLYLKTIKGKGFQLMYYEII